MISYSLYQLEFINQMLDIFQLLTPIDNSTTNQIQSKDDHNQADYSIAITCDFIAISIIFDPFNKFKDNALFLYLTDLKLLQQQHHINHNISFHLHSIILQFISIKNQPKIDQIHEKQVFKLTKLSLELNYIQKRGMNLSKSLTTSLLNLSIPTDTLKDHYLNYLYNIFN